MKKIKHIWKYITSPHYRFWIDFCSRQENLDRNMELIKQNLQLMSKPMFIYRGGVDYGYNDEDMKRPF